jgi:uncharacterized membrane protein (DUF2068 family)
MRVTVNGAFSGPPGRGRLSSSALSRRRSISLTTIESPSGRRAGRKLIDSPGSLGKQVAGISKARRFGPNIRPVITRYFSENPSGNKLEICAARVDLLEIAGASARRTEVSSVTPIQKMLRPQRRVRYLRIIAIFKILQGAILLVIGVSLLFLHSRTRWMEGISDWVDGELMVAHSRSMLYLLNKLQDVVAGGLLQLTALVALFYAAVLFTEGIGVYLQQRWAEVLMVFATATLIPFEVRHVWLDPGAVAIIILAANCFIVWFLYRVLRRERREHAVAAAAEPPVIDVRQA